MPNGSNADNKLTHSDGFVTLKENAFTVLKPFWISLHDMIKAGVVIPRAATMTKSLHNQPLLLGA